MSNKLSWIVAIALILLAVSACQPAVSPDQAQPEREPALSTVAPSASAIPSTTVLPAAPAPTLQEEKEQTMPEDPTSPQPTATESDLVDHLEEQQSDQNTTESTPDPAVQQWILLAMDDLAQRLTIATSQIEVLSFEYKVWPDASLGCPQAGMGYAQAMQDGFLIRLRVGNELYDYHGSNQTPPFLCEQATLLLPPTTLKKDEFVPPPDSDID